VSFLWLRDSNAVRYPQGPLSPTLTLTLSVGIAALGDSGPLLLLK